MAYPEYAVTVVNNQEVGPGSAISVVRQCKGYIEGNTFRPESLINVGKSKCVTSRVSFLVPRNCRNGFNLPSAVTIEILYQAIPTPSSSFPPKNRSPPTKDRRLGRGLSRGTEASIQGSERGMLRC